MTICRILRVRKGSQCITHFICRLFPYHHRDASRAQRINLHHPSLPYHERVIAPSDRPQRCSKALQYYWESRTKGSGVANSDYDRLICEAPSALLNVERVESHYIFIDYNNYHVQYFTPKPQGKAYLEYHKWFWLSSFRLFTNPRRNTMHRKRLLPIFQILFADGFLL